MPSPLRTEIGGNAANAQTTCYVELPVREKTTDDQDGKREFEGV